MSYKLDYEFDWDALYYCIVMRRGTELYFISYGKTKKEAREMAMTSPYCTTTKNTPTKANTRAILSCDINKPIVSQNKYSVFEMGYCEAKIISICNRFGIEGMYIYQDVNYSEPFYRFDRFYRTRKSSCKGRIRNREKSE